MTDKVLFMKLALMSLRVVGVMTWLWALAMVIML